MVAVVPIDSFPPKVQKGKLPKNGGPKLTAEKALCNYTGIPKCGEKRKRSNPIHESNSEAMERAQEVEANLDHEYPSLIKAMLHSHVTGGFWLGLTKKFCDEHLPKEDTMIVLEDESGKEYETKYLAAKVGLSGGWRGFSMAHNLIAGDVVVFHLVKPTKFKVYIVRSDGPDDLDGALCLLKLDSCNGQKDHEKGLLTIEEEDDKYWDSFAHDISQDDLEKDRLISNQPSKIETEDVVLDSLQGIKFAEEADIEFKQVKNIEGFNIVIDGLIFNAVFPMHVQAKYYELCCSQNSFLHERILEGLNARLVAGMISETINIADAIRTSNLSTSEQSFCIWDKTLKAFMTMGMNVGFIQARLEQLAKLASDSKKGKEARIERERAEEEKEMLEVKIKEVGERIEKLDSEIKWLELEVNSEGLEVMFKELAKAPW